MNKPYKVHLLMGYNDLYFDFTDSATAINFMMQATRSFNPVDSDKDTLEVSLKIDGKSFLQEVEREEEDDF